MAEKQYKVSGKMMGDKSAVVSDRPIKTLLSDSKISAYKQKLPEGYIEAAKKQYSSLLSDLEKLKTAHPQQFKMLEMNRKEKLTEKSKEKKGDVGGDLHNKDQSVIAIYTLLQIVEASEREWDELHYLLNARYFLKEKPKSQHEDHQSQDSHKHETKGVSQTLPSSKQGSSYNISTEVKRDPTFSASCKEVLNKKNASARNPGLGQTEEQRGLLQKQKSQSVGPQPRTDHENDTKSVLQTHDDTKKLQSSKHESRSDTHTDGKAVQTSSASFKEDSNSRNVTTQGAGDLEQTCHGFTDENRERIQLPSSNHKTQGSGSNIHNEGKSVQTSSLREVSHSTDVPSQNAGKFSHTHHVFTDEQRKQIKHEETFIESDRPISIILSQIKSAELQKALEEYRTLRDKESQLYKDREIKNTWETPSDINDVTDEQKSKSPHLFNILKNLKDKTTDAAKKVWTEFIKLTDHTTPSRKQETASHHTHHIDVPSASMTEISKHPSHSERVQLRPTEKLFQRIEMQHGKGKYEKAKGQFYLLVKRDANFKRKFPDKYSELQVFMDKPEDYQYSPYQCLYDVLSKVTKKDPLYDKVWKEYFFLVTSDQQHIIAESCGQVFKSVYKKDIDSVVVPRKSYEELQNELVEKIKQIEELTTRLSKFASQQLTAGNPNIADLSDKHRPTKIGELYSELYDNEWSEVFEVIKALRHPNTEESETEYFEDVLNTLKDILMAAYEFSAEKIESHLGDLKNIMLCSITCSKEKGTKDESTREEQKNTEYGRFVTEHARKYTKESAAYTIREAAKVFQKERLGLIFKEKSGDPKLAAYVDKCITTGTFLKEM
ncbi:uncharacterized protein LOC134274866 [Saccostrea cucullata]|uniref:uncharacterized protein LOC134274866 n=1 Tax=Saccostrea cuccullata TaxID=36930 RepID=UPI002ED6653E